MAIEYTILGEHRLVVASMAGRIDAAVVRATIRRVAVDPAFVWDHDRLVFVEDRTDMSNLDLADLRDVRDELVEAYFGGSLPAVTQGPAYRIGMVINHLGNEGITRLFSTAIESQRAPFMEMQFFAAGEEALAWLGHDTLSAADLRAAVSPAAPALARNQA